MSLSNIKKQVRETEVFAKYKNVLTMAKRSGIKFTELSEELKNMHSGRKSRTLYIKGNPSPHGLLDAVLQDASYRSRCIEIINTISFQRRMLDFTLTALHDFIVAQFSVELRALYKTNGERDTALASLTKNGASLVDDMEVIIEMAQRIISDIDQSGWAIKNAKELLELINSRGPLGSDI